jgi:hypothetical protein
MGQATAYNFIHVAEKNKSNPEFTTVVNSKKISPGRVLYALAEATDDTIAKVASGEIDPTFDAIQDRKRAEKLQWPLHKRGHCNPNALSIPDPLNTFCKGPHFQAALQAISGYALREAGKVVAWKT